MCAFLSSGNKTLALASHSRQRSHELGLNRDGARMSCCALAALLVGCHRNHDMQSPCAETVLRAAGAGSETLRCKGPAAWE